MSNSSTRKWTQADKDRSDAAKQRRRDDAARALKPLRVAILRALPREGSTLGYHTLAATARQLTVVLNEGVPREGWITGSSLNAQLRGLKDLGHITDVVVLPMNRGRGWQITPAGEQWLDQQTDAKEGT